MAKKITDENGNTYVQKKPFYKRVWFWILVVFVGFITVGIFGGDSEEPTAKNESSTEQASKSSDDEDKEKVFNRDQTVQYDGMDLKVEDVKYIKNRGEFDDLPKDQQFIAVKVKITNNNDEVLNFNPFDFKIVTDGAAHDWTYEFVNNPEIDNKHLDSGDLKKGASIEGWITGKISTKAKKIQLDYRGNIFDDEAKFIINLK